MNDLRAADAAPPGWRTRLATIRRRGRGRRRRISLGRPAVRPSGRYVTVMAGFTETGGLGLAFGHMEDRLSDEHSLAADERSDILGRMARMHMDGRVPGLPLTVAER